MREEKTQKWLVGERITKPGRGLSPPGSLWPRDAVSPGLKNESLSLQIWLCRSRSPGSGGSQSGGVGKVWRHSWLSHLGRGKFLASGGKGQGCHSTSYHAQDSPPRYPFWVLNLPPAHGRERQDEQASPRSGASSKSIT